MDNVVDLITNQDLDAFVDGELTDARLGAVCDRLLQDGAAMRRVVAIALMNEALRAMRDAAPEVEPKSRLPGATSTENDLEPWAFAPRLVQGGR